MLTMSSFFTYSQDCADGENLLVIELKTDPYGYETSWSLIDGQGIEVAMGDDFGNNELYLDSLCITEWSCLTFIILDSFGDGLLSPGYVSISLNGAEVTTISSFSKSASTSFDCLEGQSCTDAIVKGEETFPYKAEGEWFKFTPTVNGIYKMSTCDDVLCDSKIWVYDGCSNILIAEGHEGTTFYGDDGDCGTQAEISGVMIAGDDFICWTYHRMYRS